MKPRVRVDKPISVGTCVLEIARNDPRSLHDPVAPQNLLLSSSMQWFRDTACRVVSMLQVNALLGRFDRNSDGKIDYHEFIMFYPEARAAYVLHTPVL